MATVSVANTTANISGNTLALNEKTGTVTGLWTFTRAPSAPFAVQVGSAVVTYLDADMVDGVHAASFLLLAGGTMVGDLKFTDATYDIGKVGATRPRDEYLSRDLGVGRNVLGPLFAGVCGGRLTLTTAVPVTSADVTGATTIYFTPYGQWAGTIGLYDGAATWTALTFTELSLALGTLTASLPYDVFCYNNAGVATLEFLAWTNTTTRATALVLQNGVLVKSGATTRRYLGTFYTTATTTTEDSTAKRYLWNYYNRMKRPLNYTALNSNHAYTTATWRQAAANAAYQVVLVVGVAEASMHLLASVGVTNSTGTASIGISIGEDSTTTPSPTFVGGVMIPVSTAGIFEIVGVLDRMPAIGSHTYAGLEYSQAAGTTAWYYGNTALAATVAGGLSGWVEG